MLRYCTSCYVMLYRFHLRLAELGDLWFLLVLSGVFIPVLFLFLLLVVHSLQLALFPPDNNAVVLLMTTNAHRGTMRAKARCSNG